MSRYSSGRSSANPHGDLITEKVVEAILLVARWVLIVLMVVAKGAHFVFEQPNSTLMDRHAKFLFLQALADGGALTLHKVHFWMGLFGAYSPKAELP